MNELHTSVGLIFKFFCAMLMLDGAIWIAAALLPRRPER